jgi:enoyl-[acyl-carrier-protein] reductase (NADH)
MEAVFERVEKEWGELDFLVHSIAKNKWARFEEYAARCNATSSYSST